MRRSVLALLTITSLTACGLGFVGTAPRGDAGPNDAAGESDTSTTDGADDADASSIPDVDAGTDAPPTFRCPDNTPVTDCRACNPSAPIRCGQACVDNCLTCDAGPIACAFCPSITDFVATCSPDLSPSASCPLSQCACPGNAGTCPLDTMVCAAIVCVACGEPGTNDQVCKAGTGMHKCKDGTSPANDRYRCK